MNRIECLDLKMEYFKPESAINYLKNPDFELKSHIFYYRDIFKDIEEIKILRISSKNSSDNIVFDVYYVSQEFDGLFHGYFRIKPETEMAEKLFENISKVATDLGQYFYYVYKNSEILKIYLISGNLENALAHCKNKDFQQNFVEIKKATQLEIAKFSTQSLKTILLRRELLEKYITNFIKMNSKCSDRVKMFLINLLSSKYAGHICLIPKRAEIKNFIQVTTEQVFFNDNLSIPIYGLLDYAVNYNCVLFVKLDFDFKGGEAIGKGND